MQLFYYAERFQMTFRGTPRFRSPIYNHLYFSSKCITCIHPKKWRMYAEKTNSTFERKLLSHYSEIHNREYFYLPILNVWDIMTDKLAKLQNAHQIKIAAFVLMNNHFHLLLLTPNEDIDRIMYSFMKETTLEIQRCTGRINKIFGGRYKGSMITSYSYLVNVYKYIYRNPV